MLKWVKPTVVLKKLIPEQTVMRMSLTRLVIEHVIKITWTFVVVWMTILSANTLRKKKTGTLKTNHLIHSNKTAANDKAAAIAAARQQ
ncbi:hypothetical protein BGP75_16465 [Motiliproteus sp. MSK22-1]|nr:hypothetical protein BGP75_16465 [Motiliproteus sp. MSK22-1]